MLPYLSSAYTGLPATQLVWRMLTYLHFLVVPADLADKLCDVYNIAGGASYNLCYVAPHPLWSCASWLHRKPDILIKLDTTMIL